MILYLATTNRGKLRDFTTAAAGATIEFELLPGIAILPTPDEDQTTFEGNARLKAEYYSQHAPGMLVLADDSGLEVDALGGMPGVRSARYATDLGYVSANGSADNANNEALLLAMLEQTERQARYQCVLALAREGSVLATARGALGGEILTEPAGVGGFGYDPLFFVPELGCSMAQASPDDRLRFSHRGRALRALLKDLSKNI